MGLFVWSGGAFYPFDLGRFSSIALDCKGWVGGWWILDGIGFLGVS